ncbi:Nitroreductase family protein [Pelomyxa schiedti]|nr:Nitroreductase family protein [Pelomyxa schiedti]
MAATSAASSTTPASDESVFQLVLKRHSCKAFANTPIPSAVSEEIAAKLASPWAKSNTPFGKGAAFRFVYSPEHLSGGAVGHSQGTIICVCKTDEADPVITELDLSYAFARIHIELITRLGLGACWLSATLNFKRASVVAACGANEKVPFGTPLGYPGSSLISSGFNWLQGAGTRKPIDHFAKNADMSPLTLPDTHEWFKPLESVRWAPTAFNRQCVRVVFADTTKHIFHFYIEGSNQYVFQDAAIAMYHFESVANEIGKQGKWTRENLTNKGTNTYIVTWTQI